MGEGFYRNLFDKKIDFNSYSSSKCWMGYFERNKPHNIKITKEAVEYFLSFFLKSLDSFVVVSSYYLDEDNCYKTDAITNKIEKKLCKEGYIITIKGNRFFDKEQSIWEQQTSELEKSFRIYPFVCADVLKYFSYLAMNDNNFYNKGGHCFFISEADDLIIYPHADDTGYGCIGINGRNNQGYEFLKKASKMRHFDAYLYSEENHTIKYNE